MYHSVKMPCQGFVSVSCISTNFFEIIRTRTNQPSEVPSNFLEPMQRLGRQPKRQNPGPHFIARLLSHMLLHTSLFQDTIQQILKNEYTESLLMAPEKHSWNISQKMAFVAKP